MGRILSKLSRCIIYSRLLVGIFLEGKGQFSDGRTDDMPACVACRKQFQSNILLLLLENVEKFIKARHLKSRVENKKIKQTFVCPRFTLLRRLQQRLVSEDSSQRVTHCHSLLSGSLRCLLQVVQTAQTTKIEGKIHTIL